MNDNNNLLLLSIKDFFTPKMLKYSIMPFIIIMIVMYIIFFVVAGVGLDHLGTMDIQSTQTTIENGVPHTESLTAHLQDTAIIKFLMSYAITSWIATFLVYAIGGFLTLYVSIFAAVIVIGFLTPFVLKELQKLHYPDIEMVGHSNLLTSILLLIKWAFIMVVLFFLLIPLYFIPVVNVIAFNFPLYYFFHKMLTFDVSSTICSAEEDYKIKYMRGNVIWLKTLALYLLSLVPFAVYFGAIFFVIYLGHTYFTEVRKIRIEGARAV